MINYYDITPFGATPSKQQLEHFKIGKKAFFHFGVNTFTDFEWGNGSELESVFNPTDIDVRGWIKGIKAAGFKLAIITAKHHDGFCLWPSKYTEHTIAKSPYKNGNGDLIKEFTDACHEYGVKAGLYLSPWDRHSSYWGSDAYSDFYANQLTELLTEYGELDEIWWDGAGSAETKYDWGKWAYLVRKHQPNAMIFCSMGAAAYADLRWVGNEAGFAGSTHYASIDIDSIFREDVNELNKGKLGGNVYVPAEVDVSIRPGWFYHEGQDKLVKTPYELDRIWFKSVGSNAIMLLNFPPDKRGQILSTDIKNAIESNRRIEEMFSINYIDPFNITASSSLRPECEIEKAVLPDDDLYFVGGKNDTEVTIEIDYRNISTCNVLLLGELIQLGERINSFSLAGINGNDSTILAEGTSVGYLKAVRFPCGSYEKLRLTLCSPIAPITLRTIALCHYDEDKSDISSSMSHVNLSKAPGSSVNYSDDGREVVIQFGGIYSFKTIAFTAKHASRFEIFAFDGSKFYSIYNGESVNYRAICNLEKPIEGSYQIKICSQKGFAIDPDFFVG